MPKIHGTSVPKAIKPSKLLKASTLLTEAASLTEFIQAMTLIVEPNEGVCLEPEQITGMYYALEDIATRIRKAEKLIAMEGEYEN